MFKIKKATVYVNEMGDPIRVGDWRREKELGSGGFGVVSLWINSADGDCLAIKKCRWNLETNLTPKQKQRWSAEVEMMKNTRNENIVSYRKMPDVLEKAISKSNLNKLPILSMEFCSLGNLRTELLKTQNSCGFHEIVVKTILEDVSNALTYLHNLNITHRDFKPENIVLQSCNTRSTGVIYKIIDLGYAKELKSATVSFVGTLQYLAPEIFEKQTYNRTVDYWSLGITAFEVICGIRPFLPNYTPMQSFEYIKKKDLDVVCIQMTHTGDIKHSKELLKENHISMCLKQNMEVWFRSVLQFDPEKRGSLENNNVVDVFKSLQGILSKKIITVFSIHKFEFYSYEINESTLYSTVQDWIARDIKIPKGDQYLVGTKKSASNYAIDYYDEKHPDAMVFVYKKNASIGEQVSASLPKLIKIMFENIKTEFKFGTLRLLHAQVIYFVHQEVKHFEALKHGIYILIGFLKDIAVKENKLFIDVRNSIQSSLSEIEFYNSIETSLCMKVYKDTNNVHLNALLLEYEHYMHQLKEILDTTDALTNRHRKLSRKSQLVYHAFGVVINKLQNCDFSTLSKEAIKSYDELLIQNPNKNLIAKAEIIKIVSKTLKIRDTIFRDKYFLHFLKGATSFWKETDKLVSSMTAMKTHLSIIKERMRRNNIKRLDIVQDIHKHRESCPTRDFDNDGNDTIKENIVLRYKLQEFIHSNIFKYRNATKERDPINSLCFQMQNGIDLCDT